MDVSDLACIWLTTLRRDGSPHTTPIWFVMSTDAVWLASSTVNVKVRNLLRDPRVSMAFDQTSSSPWVAEGRAVVYEPPIDRVRHAAVLAALAAKYDGWDAADPAQDGPRVLIEVPVSRWLLSPA